MKDSIRHHTSLTHANEMIDICLPLLHLNITYFGYARVNKNNEFTCINNNPDFSNYYLQHDYYNADVHLANTQELGHHIMWDCVEPTGKSKKLYEESVQFGVQHAFTIVKKKENGISDFYHFANASPDKSINHTYLNHLDLLNIFIDYFHDKVDGTSLIHNTHEQTFSINENSASYSTLVTELPRNETRSHFISAIGQAYPEPPSISRLTNRELLCLELYSSGKTAKLIAEKLNLSRRTIETYLAKAKEKLHTNHKSALIEQYNILRKQLMR